MKNIWLAMALSILGSTASAGENGSDCIRVDVVGTAYYFVNGCGSPVSIAYCFRGSTCGGERYYSNLIGAASYSRTFFSNNGGRVRYAACIGANPRGNSDGSYKC